MVHNGIEYGLMQAYPEGFSILQHKREFGLDLHQIAEIWRTVAWCVPGCWTSPRRRWKRIRR
jgi:6-phosphogluconate dehydrogenase (decarboxylating)